MSRENGNEMEQIQKNLERFLDREVEKYEKGEAGYRDDVDMDEAEYDEESEYGDEEEYDGEPEYEDEEEYEEEPEYDDEGEYDGEPEYEDEREDDEPDYDEELYDEEEEPLYEEERYGGRGPGRGPGVSAECARRGELATIQNLGSTRRRPQTYGVFLF